jgi:Putative MetA-pathway of phenol degradation
MNRAIIFKIKQVTLAVSSFFIFSQCHAQTDIDAIMMNKRQLCQGLMYNYSSWDYYWEGTFKRNNQNLGTVSSQSVMYGANYGITDKLNVMFSAPYVSTKSSAGTLHGSKGLQDISVFVKWKPVSWTFGKNKIALYVVEGISTPLTNYEVDYLPLSIGMGTTNVISRGMVDYRHRRFTVTASATYIWRSNVKIDRNSYYDTQMHLTNEVKMPDASQYQLRTGYRGRYLIAEALLTNWTTLGGFDITKNNMPFPSNRMNQTTIGGSFKYTLPNYIHLSLLAGANYTIAGRNVGQASAFNVGAFYVFYMHNAIQKNINNQ